MGVKISQQRQFDTYRIAIGNHIYVHYCHDEFKIFQFTQLDTLRIVIGNHTSVIYCHNKFKYLAKMTLDNIIGIRYKDKNYTKKNNNNNNCSNKVKFNKCIIILTYA